MTAALGTRRGPTVANVAVERVRFHPRNIRRDLGDLRGYGGRIAPAAERLAGVTLEARPALEVIERFGRSPNVLLYVDPPYLGSTRSSGGYRHEMKADAQHRELAAALHACRAAVVLSGYASPLYLELYDGWHVTSRPTNTGQGGTWSERTEVLWSNRPFTQHLFSEVQS